MINDQESIDLERWDRSRNDRIRSLFSYEVGHHTREGFRGLHKERRENGSAAREREREWKGEKGEKKERVVISILII